MLSTDFRVLVDDLEFYAISCDQHHSPWNEGCARVLRRAAAALYEVKVTILPEVLDTASGVRCVECQLKGKQ